MRIAIVGSGPLADVLSRAVKQVNAPSDAEVVIFAGSEVSPDVLDEASKADRVIVDATEPPAFPNPARDNHVVRAFASVPADALAAATNGKAKNKLAIPLAGDDREAKIVVATLMREMGVEPFDLGPLKVADALEPGGALYGRALTPTEMIECVGELSGDG